MIDLACNMMAMAAGSTFRASAVGPADVASLREAVLAMKWGTASLATEVTKVQAAAAAMATTTASTTVAAYWAGGAMVKEEEAGGGGM